MGHHINLRLLSEAAVAEFRCVESCLPSEPEKFALKLLSVFFSDEVFGKSICTKAEGRQLLDQNILLGIKHKLFLN